MKVIKVEYYSKGFYRITLKDTNNNYNVVFVDEVYILKAAKNPKENKKK